MWSSEVRLDNQEYEKIRVLGLCAHGTNLLICGYSQNKSGLVLDRYTYGNRNALTFASRTSLPELSQEVMPQWVSVFYLTPTRLVLVHRDSLVMFDSVYGCEVKVFKQLKAPSVVNSNCTNTDCFGVLDVEEVASFYDKYGRKQATLKSRLLSQEKNAAQNLPLSRAVHKDDLERKYAEPRPRTRIAQVDDSLHNEVSPHSISALKDKSFLNTSFRNEFSKSPAPDTRSHKKTFTAGSKVLHQTTAEDSRVHASAKTNTSQNFGMNIKYYRRPF